MPEKLRLLRLFTCNCPQVLLEATILISVRNLISFFISIRGLISEDHNPARVVAGKYSDHPFLDLYRFIYLFLFMYKLPPDKITGEKKRKIDNKIIIRCIVRVTTEQV